MMPGKETSMKRFLLVLMALTMVMGSVSFASADTAVMYDDDQLFNLCADPNSNVDNPFDLSSSSYTSTFNFAKYTTTKAIKVPSDGNATVTLTDACMNFSSSSKPTVYVKAYYWNGSTWKNAKVTPSSVKVSKTKANYSFTVSGISSGSAFYVKLLKTEYSGYKFTGKIEITD
ncbi:MAG: hypothetical protein Q4B32_01675 [Clostridia bacterium]|nr:hypothetical protein [Clostridia bacterium]